MTAPDLKAALTAARAIANKAQADIDALGIPARTSLGVSFQDAQPDVIAIVDELKQSLRFVGSQRKGTVYDSCTVITSQGDVSIYSVRRAPFTEDERVIADGGK